MKYGLILLFISCCRCRAIPASYEGLIEYAQFLSNSMNGQPTEAATPELANLQSEWSRSGNFEGDIILDENERQILLSNFMGFRNALRNSKKLWPDKTIYYSINATSYSALFAQTELNKIHEAMSTISKVSCLKFKKRTNETSYVFIQGNTKACNSNVGRSGNKQTLNLNPKGCFRTGTIIHEFLHAAGFHHMQSTYDRDDWVHVFHENIKNGSEHNFQTYSSALVTNLGEPYDYGSVMHYGEFDFSRNGKKTIEAIKPHLGIELGQRKGMSKIDIIKLNKLYKCPGY